METYTHDCCFVCGEEIPSMYQLQNRNTEVCENCRSVDFDEEER